MKIFLSVTIAVLAVFANGNVNAQSSSTPPCRAGTLDLRAFSDPSDLGSAPTVPSVSCSGDLISRKKGAVPQAALNVDSAESRCDFLLANGYNYGQDGLWQESYDTLRLFMEQCPFYHGGQYNGAVDSWDEFTDIGGAVTQWQAGGAGRWPDFLTWLKKVLYLNPDSIWYCDDVSTMLTALQNDEAAQEAATKYVVESGKCPAMEFANLFKYESINRHQLWLDSLRKQFDSAAGTDFYWPDSIGIDTLAHPYDSTIPSLYAEDLQILMGPQYADVQQAHVSSPQALLSAQLLENPMKSEIDISFDMGRTALVTMQLSDVLGRTVPLTYAKYQLAQPGQHDASIPAPNLPPGTYYLRITTDVGDAVTLKVVKE
jgi:hypothetical protein